MKSLLEWVKKLLGNSNEASTGRLVFIGAWITASFYIGVDIILQWLAFEQLTPEQKYQVLLSNKTFLNPQNLFNYLGFILGYVTGKVTEMIVSKTKGDSNEATA